MSKVLILDPFSGDLVYELDYTSLSLTRGTSAFVQSDGSTLIAQRDKWLEYDHSLRLRRTVPGEFTSVRRLRNKHLLIGDNNNGKLFEWDQNDRVVFELPFLPHGGATELFPFLRLGFYPETRSGSGR